MLKTSATVKHFLILGLCGNTNSWKMQWSCSVFHDFTNNVRTSFKMLDLQFVFLLVKPAFSDPLALFCYIFSRLCVDWEIICIIWWKIEMYHSSFKSCCVSSFIFIPVVFQYSSHSLIVLLPTVWIRFYPICTDYLIKLFTCISLF